MKHRSIVTALTFILFAVLNTAATQKTQKSQKSAPRDNAIRQYNLGLELGNQARWLEAIEAYKQAIKISPDFPDAYNNLGNAHSKLGRTHDAIAAYLEAIRINPNFPKAFGTQSLHLCQNIDANQSQ